jgi:glyoxylase-like metal-dependent hydrolase (beta-lactamase superfamily II)
LQISAIPEPIEVSFPRGVHLERADNPGPLSLSGTNTWILAGNAGDRTVVIDPGPPLPGHLAAIRAYGRPAAIVLTHQHLDHSEAAPALSAEFDVPVYAALPELAIGRRPLEHGDLVVAAGWAISVYATPGHTSDSTCFAIPGAVFTGDTLLGGSTTIIAPPSGSLAEYFDTMNRLSAFGDLPGFPGHGPAFGSVAAWAARNAEYRQERLAQLAQVFERARANGSTPTLGQVASAAYGVNGAPVEAYVEAMTAAQLSFLSERGDITGWN